MLWTRFLSSQNRKKHLLPCPMHTRHDCTEAPVTGATARAIDRLSDTALSKRPTRCALAAHSVPRATV
eukprot:585662-Prymnesium_polylepis.1